MQITSIRFATLIIWLFGGFGTTALLAERFEFAIPGDDTSQTVLSLRPLLGEPIGQTGFVEVRDGHFFREGKRLKFWGMNLCFAANFPSKDAADFIAPHLAKIGCNAVRFHHMDNQAAPSGIWAKELVDGRRVLDAEMVDRLDYFLAKLHSNGIYADLNLHVSRELSPEEGYPVGGDGPWWTTYNKWVMYYDPDVQRELKRYCRELLLHRNPYRGGLRRVDDPGVALVEMLNENYFSEQGYDLYRRLPLRYQRSFVRAWNAWLAEQYPSTRAMVEAWEKRDRSNGQLGLGEPLITSESWADSRGAWYLTKGRVSISSQFGVPAEHASAAEDRFGVRLQPAKASDQDYLSQLGRGGLSTLAGKPMTLSFLVRSDRPRKFHAELSTQAGGQWRALGLYEHFDAGPQWKRVVRVIQPAESIEGDASFQFSFGDSTVPIEFADVSLYQGVAIKPLPQDQSIERGTVGVPAVASSPSAHTDMQRFMVETEVAWVNELKQYLRNDLDVKVPITASQINYHPPQVHLESNDFVDLHNYWHHPMFPANSNWDPNRWTVGNQPIESEPELSRWPTNSLLMRAGWRYAGKPFTMSEWNYPEPSVYAVGCVPIAAVLASLQDWDGVFFFQYDQNAKTADDWRRKHTQDFFSFNGSPTKTAAFAAWSRVFLRGDIERLSALRLSPIGKPISGEQAFQYRLGVSSSITIEPRFDPVNLRDLNTPNGRVDWDSDPESGTGVIRLITPASRAVWGTIEGGEYELGDMSIRVDTLEPNYGMFVASSLDGRSIESSSRVLLTLATSSENQAMDWNADKTSVGTRWGHGPTSVAAIEGRVVLPGAREVWVLDYAGRRRSKKAAVNGSFEISPDDQTFFYEVVR
ncbi:MAG: hypothetical protein AAF664_03000 [Planctomycetota bacterium]